LPELSSTWSELKSGVHAEDGLLATRFGEEFHQYKRTTPAYLPFVR
jgi:protein-S-isoprenylcysteine O-methyltransferase Ste14